MAYSIQTAVSDGTLEVLDLSIKYMDKSHIFVYVDDVLVDGNAYSYVWLTDTRIKVTPVIASGSTLKVVRKTLTDEMWHEFSKGARFSTVSMDENFEQLLFLAQEYSEGIYVKDFFTDVDLHLKRILNLGDPINDSDAVNLKTLKEYLPNADLLPALTQRIAAEELKSTKLDVQGIPVAIKLISNYNATDTVDGAWIHFAGRDTIGDGGGGWFRYLKNSTTTVDGGTTFAPVGGGRLIRDATWRSTGVDPRWFGVKATGTGDDTADFNAARAVAAAAKTTLIISGTPRITGRLNLFEREHWRFVGCLGNADGSYPGSYLIKAANVNDPLVYLAADGCFIEGGGIVGESGCQGDGFQIAANGVRLDNPYTNRVGRDGIRIGSDASGVNANSFLIDRPVAINNGRHGIYVHDEDTEGSPSVDANAGTIIQPFAQSCVGDGVKVGKGYYVTLLNPCSEFNSGSGLRVVSGAKRTTVFGGDLGEANGEDLTIETGAQDTVLYNTFFATWSDSGTRTQIYDGTTSSFFTPSLAFGGSNAGQVGTYTGYRRRIGDSWQIRCTIQLTNKGTATGGAQLVGLPVASASGGDFALQFGSVSGMSGLTSPLFASVAGGTGIANIYTSGATGFSGITHDNFTDGAVLHFTGIYPAS